MLRCILVEQTPKLHIALEEEQTMPFNFNILTLAGESGSATNTGGSWIYTILMILVIIAVFYFFMIRPESKKRKAADNMRSNLKVGDEITTIGGIVGTVCAVKNDTIVIETGADRVRIEFTKWAISSKGTQKTEEAPAEKETKADAKKDKNKK